MLEKIYLLLEMSTVIICLYGIHKVKIKLSFNTVAFITLEILFTEMVTKGVISSKVYFIIYILFVAYGYLEFKENIRGTIFSVILSIMIIGYVQIFIAIPCYEISQLEKMNEDVLAVVINGITFFTILVLGRLNIFNKIYRFCKSKDLIINLCMIICAAVMVYCMYLLKDSSMLRIDIVAIVVALIFCSVLMLLRWQQADNERKQHKEQLKLANHYRKEFSDLVETARKRQHDFKNHMNALKGMKGIHNRSETEEHQKYCEAIENNNRILKILNNVEQPVLAGFFYNRICHLSEKGIKLDLNLAVTSEELGIEIYDCIDIIGILLDNAVEAVETSNLEKEIYLEMLCYNKNMKITVRNVSRHYENDEMAVFFKKGYSTKGENRGIGLDKIRDLQNKYKFDIMVQMEELHNKEWISFAIIKE